MFKNVNAKNAFFIGTLCSISYLAVYFARNMLSAVSPQMIETGGFTTEYIGSASSLYFITYAIGQLVNGAIGDKVKGRYMISFGLILAGICSFIFPHISFSLTAAKVVYGLTGFFLAMIYGPMTKIVAENTEPVYAVRCSLGYTFASFFGSPLAGAAAVILAWDGVFTLGSIILLVMGAFCFAMFGKFEKKGIVQYNMYGLKDEKKGSIRLLIQHQIIKFTFISVLTGIIRTTVVFWLPTYLSQYLGFSAQESAGSFTAATLIMSFAAVIAIFVYERLKNNMDLSIFLFFCISMCAFLLVYFVKSPAANIVCLIVAIMASNCAASIMWSRYCPGLRDTGMVSSATGFLDFMSYMAASISSTLFANAVAEIGWENLILIWFALMVGGVIVAAPWKKRRKGQEMSC